MKTSLTPGGKRLRALREYHGLTQLDVELDGSLGIGYLQRLESGRVQQPERETLERILNALKAHYTERREVLELFGYVVDAPIPEDAEIEWAVRVCAAELQSAVFPAYLLDCAHRLLYWNHFVPHLFPLAQTGDHPSILKMLFANLYGVTALIKNGDEFFPAQIRALRYEMQRFRAEPWYERLLAEMLQYPLFQHHWIKEGQQPVHIPARPLTLLEIEPPKAGVLRFRLIAEPFVHDQRFRVIYYLPADAQTIQQCLQWNR